MRRLFSPFINSTSDTTKGVVTDLVESEGLYVVTYNLGGGLFKEFKDIGEKKPTNNYHYLENKKNDEKTYKSKYRYREYIEAPKIDVPKLESKELYTQENPEEYSLEFKPILLKKRDLIRVLRTNLGADISDTGFKGVLTAINQLFRDFKNLLFKNKKL